jgi:hypothetical protein
VNPLVVNACRAIAVLQAMRQEETDVLTVNVHEVGPVGSIDFVKEALRILFGKGVIASGESAFFCILLHSHGWLSCAGKIPAF